MDRKYIGYRFGVCVGLLAILILASCSNKKNTAITRAYHSINTRYNIHFNAEEAYKEALKTKENSEDEADNLSRLLNIYPEILDSADLKYKGRFSTTIEKTTKAIKLHSITTRPRRDPNKRGNEEYRQWIKQKEFNPFLVNTWMLMAKAEFQEGNYLRAVTTFMHISKIYDYDKRIVSECKLWIARAYSEMGWKYEAENVLRKMEQNDEIHHELTGMYATIKANIHIRNKNYESAIPFLEEAVRKEKRGNVKRRNKYLLGQLYAETGNNSKAAKAFSETRGLTAPYKYIINSKIRELEFSDLPEAQRIKSLKKMAKSVKNEDYQDQLYSVIGDIYLSQLDTANAVINYSEAVQKSTKDGYDKMIAQVKLGGLYFDTKEYIKAQPCYADAISNIRKDDEYYPIVSLRSEVLDKLASYANVVYEQDSLLHLANMPEEERLAVISEHIEKLKKEEAQKKKEEQLESLESQREITGWGSLENWTAPTTQTGNTSQQVDDFYFYNAQTVEKGKAAFQRQWGRRPLEDNWRRKNKNIISDEFGFEEDQYANSEQSRDSDIQDGISETEDIYTVEYYLNQIPLTDEAKQESYRLIENALFNIGLIYKDMLEDYTLAIETFGEDLNRFPDTPNREEIYYQLFLIYLKTGNQEMTALYRDKLINEYAEGKYASPLSDPNYVWNFTYMSKLQEDMYQEAYTAYLAGDVQKVRNLYTDVRTKFPFVDLMPKFAFLNSLSYAQTKDARSMEKYLTELISEFPQADVTPLAANILKNIKDGKIILADGTPITSLDWTMAYTNDSIFEGEEARTIEYLTDLDKPYILLLTFKPKTIDRNDLLYEVADYNFSNYVIQTFDLRFHEDELLSSLEINGFSDFKSIQSYLNKAMDEEGLLTKLDRKITPVPISASNYTDIFPRLGMEQYMTFYVDSLADATPQLTAYWSKDDTDDSLDVTEQETATEQVKPTEEEDKSSVVPKSGEEKLVFPVAPDRKETDKGKDEQQSDKEINLEDILSKEQVEAIGRIDKKTDDIAEAISNLGSNPVEGLKNIFNRNKLEDNLTKEEKEELKRQQKEDKQRKKELEKQEKVKQDSIMRAEKLRLDSVHKAEKAVEDSIKAVKQAEKDRIAQEKQEREHQAKEQAKARIQEQKAKEDARKQQLKDREDRRRQQERERSELQKERERKREEMIKQKEEERRQKEKERKKQSK